MNIKKLFSAPQLFYSEHSESKQNSSSLFPVFRKYFLNIVFRKYFLTIDHLYNPQNSERQYVEESLNLWSNESEICGFEKDQRKIVANAILQCYANKNSALSLSQFSLTSLPQRLDYLTPLQTLDLSDNQLTSFDSTLPISLQRLNLSNNNIISFGSTLPASLQVLSLSNNLLTSFSLTLPASLREFFLSHNQLTSFDSTLPASLQRLSLSHNQLTAFDSILPASLQGLYLDRNKLTSFSSTLPASLQTLNLSSNQLTSFSSTLPTSLQELLLSDNQLTFFSSTLPAPLLSLHLSRNQLTSFSSTLPASLIELNLSNNNIISFGSTLPASLQVLNLSNNNIISFGLTLPASLQVLSLSKNLLTSFSLTLPASLREFTLSNNLLTSNAIEFHVMPDTIRHLRLFLGSNPCVQANERPGTIWLRVHSGVIQDIPAGQLHDLGIEVLPDLVQNDAPIASLKENLVKLFGQSLEEIQTTYKELLDHRDAGILATFIERMTMSWPKYDPSLRSLIILAKNNPHFRAVLFEEVFSTSIDCHDRPLYFFSRLSAQAAAYQAQTENNPQQLVQHLIALHHLRVIEEHAEKVSAGEALEIALYLQLQLKETLMLPIAIDSMAHTEYAKRLIRDYLQDPTQVLIQGWITEVARRCLSTSATREQQLNILATSQLVQQSVGQSTWQLEDDYAAALEIFNAETESPTDHAKEIANRILNDGETGRSVEELQRAWNNLSEARQVEIQNNLMAEQESQVAKLRTSLAMDLANSLLAF